MKEIKIIMVNCLSTALVGVFMRETGTDKMHANLMAANMFVKVATACLLEEEQPGHE